MEFAQLQKDMIAAMKAHDKDRKDAISSLVSAVKKLAIDEGTREDITPEQVDRAVLKEFHSAQEQYESCPEERAELKAEYKLRLDVISEYAPKMMSLEEIEAELKANFSEVLATKNKGQIMKSVMPALKGKAEGKDIQKVISNMLA